MGMECGMDRTKIHVSGGLSIDALDGYFHPVEPGMDYVREVLLRL